MYSVTRYTVWYIEIEYIMFAPTTKYTYYQQQTRKLPPTIFIIRALQIVQKEGRAGGWQR